MKNKIIALSIILILILGALLLINFSTHGNNNNNGNRIAELLEITPDPLQKKLLNLAARQDYPGIKQLINKITFEMPDGLTKLTELQLDLAIFIVDRIDFDIIPEDSHAFDEQEQEAMTSLNPHKRVKMQWLYRLLMSKDTLQETKTLEAIKNSLQLIQSLLDDIGYISPIEIKNIGDIKKALSENFRLLFEHFQEVKRIEPHAAEY